MQPQWGMSPRNFGGGCWNFLQRTAGASFTGGFAPLLCWVPAYFALLAEAADGFAEAHREGGYRFEALLAAVREAAIIFAAHLGEQELGVAQDSGERIVHLVAEDLAERFPVQNIFRAGKLLRI